MLERPPVMSNTAIYFFNWSEDVFTYPWGGKPYTFLPKERMLFPEGIAWHFAKHLAEHFFNSKNTVYNLAQLQVLLDKGLIRDGAITASSEEELKILSMNAKPQVMAEKKEEPKPESKPVDVPAEESKPKKKLGRPKKVVKSDLEEFEGV